MDVWRKLPMFPLLMIGILLVTALGWISSLPMKAGYANLIIEQGYFEDDARLETIDSIHSQQFTSFKGPLFLGNDLRPLWLKLTIAPSEFNDLVLLTQPNFTHHIELWTPMQNGWAKQVVGLKHAFADREIATLAPSLPLNVSSSAPTTVFVKVESPSTPVAVRVLKTSDNAHFNALMHLVAGLLIGVGLLIAAVSFLVYQATKDQLWAIDAGFNFIGLVVLSSQLGFLTSIAFPKASTGIAHASLYLNALYVGYAIFFYTRLFRLLNVPDWVLRPYTILFILFPLVPALIWFGHGDNAMQINNTVIGLVTFWGVIVVALSRHPDPLIRWVFRVGYGLLNLYFLVWALPVIFEWQTGNLFTLYPSLPISLFSMLLMMLVLARNTQLKMLEIHRLAKEKETAELNLRQAQVHHEETSSFFSMLMHEVKNPLSVIRMTTVNLERDVLREMPSVPEPVQMRMARLQQAVTHVDNVLERGVEIDQLVQSALLIKPESLNVTAWLSQWCQQQPAAERIRIESSETFNASVDVALLELMAQNLIDNALKYAADNSDIICSVRSDDLRWGLSIRNAVGPIGLPDPERLFSKYYRASAAMHLGGFGLGLYWVRGVARRLNGDVTYQGNQQEVVFTLWLPN